VHHARDAPSLSPARRRVENSSREVQNVGAESSVDRMEDLDELVLDARVMLAGNEQASK